MEPFVSHVEKYASGKIELRNVRSKKTNKACSNRETCEKITDTDYPYRRLWSIQAGYVWTKATISDLYRHTTQISKRQTFEKLRRSWSHRYKFISWLERNTNQKVGRVHRDKTSEFRGTRKDLQEKSDRAYHIYTILSIVGRFGSTNESEFNGQGSRDFEKRQDALEIVGRSPWPRGKSA